MFYSCESLVPHWLYLQEHFCELLSPEHLQERLWLSEGGRSLHLTALTHIRAIVFRQMSPLGSLSTSRSWSKTAQSIWH